MKYSLVADIMFVAPGEHGPVWPDEAGLCKAMDLAKTNGLNAIEIFDFEGRDLELLAAEAKKRGMEIISFWISTKTTIRPIVVPAQMMERPGSCI